MDQIEKDLANFLKTAKAAIVFTGAGMSTESGIPDFRSSGGIWQKVDIQKVATPEGFRQNPDLFLEFYRHRVEDLQKVKPNSGHLVLAKWEEKGMIKGIITQNIDRLHQEAGSKMVIELHGNLREVRCSGCHKIYDSTILLNTSSCDSCKSLLRPNVVLFNESLPEQAFAEAERRSSLSDLFLVLGSSLQVSPANFMPRLAKENGAKLCILNRDTTPFDGEADWVINQGIGETLERIDAMLKSSV